jgi:hypothetical protein
MAEAEVGAVAAIVDEVVAVAAAAVAAAAAAEAEAAGGSFLSKMIACNAVS